MKMYLKSNTDTNFVPAASDVKSRDSVLPQDSLETVFLCLGLGLALGMVSRIKIFFVYPDITPNMFFADSYRIPTTRATTSVRKPTILHFHPMLTQLPSGILFLAYYLRICTGCWTVLFRMYCVLFILFDFYCICTCYTVRLSFVH